jgi:hypothetical protein
VSSGQSLVHRVLPAWLLLLLLPVLPLLLWQSADLVYRDLKFTQLETEVSFWGQGRYVPTEARRQKTDAGIQRLVSTSPAHPDYLSLQAAQKSWEAYWAESEESRLVYSRQSVLSQQRALETRPVHPQSWVKMLEYASRTPDGAGLLEIARSRLTEFSSGAE